VDGQERPIYRANSLFRAVELPPGEHSVELRYESPAIALGIQLTVLAACLAGATLTGALLAHACLRPRARRRRQVAR
jgi:hypothetical protein